MISEKGSEVEAPSKDVLLRRVDGLPQELDALDPQFASQLMIDRKEGHGLLKDGAQERAPLKEAHLEKAPLELQRPNLQLSREHPITDPSKTAPLNHPKAGKKNTAIS